LIINEIKDFITIFVEFSFNFGFVASKETDVLGSLLLLLLFNGRKGSPGSSAGANGVLEGDGKEISFLDCQVSVSSYNFMHSV
jgi:hypothetical protein